MPDQQEPLDAYVDGVQFGTSPFTMVLRFTQAPVGGGPGQSPLSIANIRMSLEHAKVMAILLRKTLREYETQQGTPIPLHPQIYQQLGLSREEDW